MRAFCVITGIVSQFLVTSLSLRANLSRDVGKIDFIAQGGQFIVENSFQIEHTDRETIVTLESSLLITPAKVPRLSLQLEPVLWAWESSVEGSAVRGFGDTDLSIPYVVTYQQEFWPLVIAGPMAKLPTARDREIGTGKLDYGAFIIVGREFGDLDVNLLLEFERFGQPDPRIEDPIFSEETIEDFEEEIQDDFLEDQFRYTLLVDYQINENLGLYFELEGHTRETKDLNGQYTLGMGFEWDMDLNEMTNIYIEAGYDTDKLMAVAAGFEIYW